MMGIKTRAFDPLPPVTLEDLVPSDHFYRHLHRSLDLGFVRELVRDVYADIGRPSIDPEVFFKLQLILFFEGLRSERQLMQVVADRLRLRWYLGYDLTEPLPDHSSLTRIRERYGLEIFRRFFETIVAQCLAAGLVWGRELYFDATKVEANASLDSVAPRFAVEAHVGALFAAAESTSVASEGADDDGPTSLPTELTAEAHAGLAEAAAHRHDWIGEAGRPDRSIMRGEYRRTADFRASATDPDASLMRYRGGGLDLGYHDHYVVDGGKARIILTALVTPAAVMENQPMLDLLWRVCFRWKLRPRQVTGDTTNGTTENIVALEDAGIRAYMPLPDFDHRTAFFGRDQFTYDSPAAAYHCPGGQTLRFRKPKYTERTRVYQAPAAACNTCLLKTQCTTSAKGRQVKRSFDEAYLERVRGYHGTEAYAKAMRKRKVWVEPLFAEAKDWHGLRRFRLRGLERVNGEALLIATGQNLKRLLSRSGWGRRPCPSGAAGLVLLEDAVALLTLTGPGGVGKTCLALALAQDVPAGFADGVVFVDLSPLADPQLVATTVAAILEVTPSPDRAVGDAIVTALRPQQRLVILDNCEHVLDAAADLMMALMAGCPAVQVLVISRAPLQVRGEQLFPVDPLSLPAVDAPLQTIAETEAVRLFVARARAVRPA